MGKGEGGGANLPADSLVTAEGPRLRQKGPWVIGPGSPGRLPHVPREMPSVFIVPLSV